MYSSVFSLSMTLNLDRLTFIASVYVGQIFVQVNIRLMYVARSRLDRSVELQYKRSNRMM